jgi:hypothetical protein
VERQQQKTFDCHRQAISCCKDSSIVIRSMKNLFFSLVFMLVGWFAFANGSSSKTDFNLNFSI